MQKDILHILLVDDNEDDTYMVQEAFADAHSVSIISVVRDGEEAMAYLCGQGIYKDAARPALVLLDINMPKKNGFEVLQEMKSDPRMNSIPVVMLTTSERDEDVVRSYAKGACSFISKPVEIEKFRLAAQHFSFYWRLVATTPSNEHTLRASS